MKEYSEATGRSNQALSNLRTTTSFNGEMVEYNSYMNKLAPLLDTNIKDAKKIGITVGSLYGTLYIMMSAIWVIGTVYHV